MSKVNSKLKNMTPLEIFKLQVEGTMNAERRKDTDYIPPHMGGPLGQRAVMDDKLVMNIVDFEGNTDE